MQHCITTTLRCTTFEADRDRLQWTTRPNKTEQECTHAPFSQSKKNYRNLKGSAHSHVSTSRNWNPGEEIGPHTTTHHHYLVSSVLPHLVSRRQRPVITTQSSVPVVYREGVRQRGGKEGEAACQYKCSCLRCYLWTVLEECKSWVIVQYSQMQDFQVSSITALLLTDKKNPWTLLVLKVFGFSN